MSIFFSGTEILEVAMGLERNGEVFYKAMADKTPGRDAKATYDYLAGEERKHLNTFKSMQDSAGSYQPPETYPGEYMLYLKSLIDNAVFKDSADAQRRADGAAGESEAFDIGIQAEKDSILFYTEMQNFVGTNDRKIVNDILNEERTHLKQLAELKQQIAK
jgi:rubrerythrin